MAEGIIYIFRENESHSVWHSTNCPLFCALKLALMIKAKSTEITFYSKVSEN